ncbi:MAG: hypothetical protein QM820_15100 [Minicystis sp.]
MDGGYLVARGSERVVAHIEFHRRHQDLDELAIDVAEAQIRLFRRERLPVLSLVWDLYGSAHGSLVEMRALAFGAAHGDAFSQAVYWRVNLRSLGWQELLSGGPPTLWPLVALTRDGATEAAVEQASRAIEARSGLSGAERADHLAVLWFVAEAEDLPVRVMKDYISEERLMESALWRSAVEKGEARAEVRLKADTISRILTHRLGALDAVVNERIRSRSDLPTLTAWYEEALLVVDADGARRLADKIQHAPLPSPSP